MHTLRLGLLAGLAAVASCSLDTSNRPQVPPSLRIVNASLRTQSVHLHIDANAASLTTVPLPPKAVEFSCPMVLNGNHLFDFVQNDTLYATVQGSLIMNATYLVVLVDAVVNGDTTYRTIVAGDDVETAPAGNNGIRLINGTSRPGDVYITPINEDPSPGTRVVSNLGPAATTQNLNLSFFMRPQSANRVRLYDVGTTTNPRSDILLTDTDVRGLTTVIFLERTSTADQGGIQVNACN